MSKSNLRAPRSGKSKSAAAISPPAISLAGVPDVSPIEPVFAVVVTSLDGSRRIVKKWSTEPLAIGWAKGLNALADDGSIASVVQQAPPLAGIPDESEPENLFAIVVTAPDGSRRIIKKWLREHEADGYARGYNRIGDDGSVAEKMLMLSKGGAK